jgi:hypothetical protein
MMVTSSTTLEDIQKKFPEIVYNIMTVTCIEEFLKKVREKKQIFILYNNNGRLTAEKDRNILGEL